MFDQQESNLLIYSKFVFASVGLKKRITSKSSWEWIPLLFSPTVFFFLIKDREKSMAVNIIYGAPNKNAVGK